VTAGDGQHATAAAAAAAATAAAYRVGYFAAD